MPTRPKLSASVKARLLPLTVIACAGDSGPVGETTSRG